jgi:hypothetical protein
MKDIKKMYGAETETPLIEKKKTFTTFLILMVVVCSAFTTNAQVRINVNLGVQPAWGPSGYDYVDYYYLPDADAYYNVNRRVFTYWDGRYWITRPSLPGRYANMDLYRSHKIVINNQRDPWTRNNYYRSHYSSYRGNHRQQVIRDSREEKYWQNPGHPQYNRWKSAQGNGNRNNGNNREYRNVNNSQRPVNVERNRGSHDRRQQNHGDNNNGSNKGNGHGKGR